MFKRAFVIVLAATTSLFAAAPIQTIPATKPTDEIVATVGERVIHMSQIRDPMIEAYGLAVLMNVVTLELAKQTAEKNGLSITDADVQSEHDKLLAQLAPDADKKDYDNLVQQLLDKQRLSHQEFDMMVRTRAYLRKIAQPLLAGKITDENVKEAFATLYGETVKVRHIQCTNLQEIAEVRRHLAAGESFAQVARLLSRNKQSGEAGGELPAFSRQTPGLPQSFKDAAFDLKEGEISDPVSAESAYHLIKMEKRVAPKAVKFDDVKDIVRKELEERLMIQAQKSLLQQISEQAVAVMKIENPILKKQYEGKLKQRDAMIRDREQLRKQIEKSRPTPEPSTAPIEK